MKTKDQSLLEEAYQTIIETESSFACPNPQMKHSLGSDVSKGYSFMGNGEYSNSPKLRLFWTTDEGCDWLEKMVDVPDRAGVVQIVHDYMSGTKEAAGRLLRGWQSNGEEVTLFPAAECEDKEIEQSANRYLDSI